MRLSSGFPSTFSKRFFAAASVAVVSIASLVMTGCGNGIAAGPGEGFGTQGVKGVAFGGSAPIGGATVSLYITGTTGYGSGNAAAATVMTSTDGTGAFDFSSTSYSCPTGSQAYLVLRGGDPTGGDPAVTGNNNSAIALLAPLGACPRSNLAPYTVINEVSTAATIFATQQFFNAATETIGAPASTQAQQGLANAFQVAMSIVPNNSGIANTTYTPGSNISGSIVTATPETSKLNAIANILASCVNTTVNTSPICSDLFNSAIAPPEASATSGATTLTGGIYPTATDTLMAVDYMATNPISGTIVSGANKTGTNSNCAAAGNTSVSNITCLFNLIPAIGAAWPTSLQGPTGTPALLDWTLSVAYSATGNCGVAGSPLNDSWHGAVDASGNVWIITDSVLGTAGTTPGTYTVLNEIGPTGNLQVCVGGNSTSQGGQMAFGRDVLVDQGGNIWLDTNGGNIVAANLSSTGYRNRVDQYIPSSATINGQTNFATSLQAYYMTMDGLGNLYVTTEATGGALYQFPNAWNLTGTTNTPIVVGPAAISGTSTQNFYGIQADSNNNIFITNEGGVTDYVYVPATSTTTTPSFSGKSQASTGPYNGVIDANGYLVIANTCCTAANANIAAKTIPGTAATPATGTTAGPVSTKYAGGLSSSRSAAIDGANNWWAASGVATNSSGYGNIVELDANLVGLSPASTGLLPSSCATTVTTSCQVNGGFAKSSVNVGRGVAIDGSGNVWVFSSAGPQVTQLLGAAVPVVTPLSIATEYNRLGKMPTAANYMSFSLPAETETVSNAYNASVKFSTNSPTPTGTITLTPAGGPTCTLVSTSTPFTGTLSCPAANSTLTAGTYKVTFTYSGDSNYAATPVGMTTTLTVQ